MVGVFQLFGVSFLFWVIVGLLRFIFETLRRMRDTPRALSRLNLALATFGGIGVSTSLFFLVFIGFGLAEALQAESALPALILATLIVWLACIGIGAYLASRIYIYRPYLVSGASGIGTAALAVLLLIYAGVSIMDALASLAWEVGWISVTLIAVFSCIWRSSARSDSPIAVAANLVAE